MTNSPVEPFLDNWAYLKAELNWLERVLMVAIARQRRESREVNRVAQSSADRATSHWWKGLIVVEGDGVYDDGKQPPQRDSTGKASPVHQLEARIQASQQQGIPLGLPRLRDRLQLTPFEKNLVLVCLAPEVNRRYTRLYRYLQSNDPTPEPASTSHDLGKGTRLSVICGKGTEQAITELPIVDLALRIFCRNDTEWQVARSRLGGSSPLIQLGLVQLVASVDDTLLSSRFKSSQALATYLLSHYPDAAGLDAVLMTSPQSAFPSTATFQPAAFQPAAFQPAVMQPSLRQTSTQWLQTQPVETKFEDLILPQPLIARLQHLCHRWQHQTQVNQTWGFQAENSPVPLGTIALLTGKRGTGKTLAAQAIAHTLQTPLVWIDLALVPPADYTTVIQTIHAQQPLVLLICNAQAWMGRSSPLPAIDLNHLLHHRRTLPCITLWSAELLPTIHLPWQQQMDDLLVFPQPDWKARRQLWQQAFPPQAPLDPDLDWDALARRFRLTGGQIRTIARNAAIAAIADSDDPQITLSQIFRVMGHG